MSNEAVASGQISLEAATRIVHFALDMGENLQICGGEVSRVEDTIQRICRAYGAERADVFSITSVIFATVIWEGGIVITQSRRIKGIEKNTARIAEINSISRSVCTNPVPVEQAEAMLERAMKRNRLTKTRVFIGSLIAAASYTAFFGGDWKDVLVTFGVAALVALCQFASSYLGGNRILANVLCCFIASTVTTVAVMLGLGSSPTMIMSGCIMLLIPGISMTSAIENLIIGDTLSGLLGLMEALITALALAGGYGLSQLLVGGITI